MIYYLVKSVSTATEGNPNFKGSVVTHYNGKKDFCFKRSTTGNYSDYATDYDGISKFNLASYGYKSEAQAKRCYSYKHPENSKNWTTEVSIICVEA